MKLGLVIDLDTCVGCHACAVACKEWNDGSKVTGPLPDYDARGPQPSGVAGQRTVAEVPEDVPLLGDADRRSHQAVPGKRPTSVPAPRIPHPCPPPHH